jgi:hypothetical protein
LLEEQQLETTELLVEFLVAESRELVGHAAVVGTNLAVLIDEFIEEVSPFVVGQDHA